MPVMARKGKSENPEQPADQPASDRHASKKMFRLDEDIHALYSLLSSDENRPISWEIKPLLIQNLKNKGYLPVTQAIQQRLEFLGLWTPQIERLLRERGFWPPQKKEKS